VVETSLPSTALDLLVMSAALVAEPLLTTVDELSVALVLSLD